MVLNEFGIATYQTLNQQFLDWKILHKCSTLRIIDENHLLWIRHQTPNRKQFESGVTINDFIQIVTLIPRS